MKIKKSDLKIIIENYLNEAAPTNKKEADAFRQWLNDTYPEDAHRLELDPPSEKTKNNAYVAKAYRQFGKEYEADTEYFGLGKYLPSFGDDEEESKKSEKPKPKSTTGSSSANGCVIMCHWTGSKPLSKSLGLTGMEKQALEYLFPQGHGGIILIAGDGSAHYFDFGRYSGQCSKSSLDKLRGVIDKYVLQGKYTPKLIKKSLATGGKVRYASLGKANIVDYDPDLMFDPVKSFKKFTGTGMITVTQKEARRLGQLAKKKLGSLHAGELYICPDVNYVQSAIDYGLSIKDKCHLYTLLPVMDEYNCGTFATHLAYIAGKGQGLISSFWNLRVIAANPTTQPSELIPNTAELMDYTEVVTGV